MKKQILLIAIILVGWSNSYSQISLQHTFSTDRPDRIVNLSLSGLKYVHVHYDLATSSLSSITLYNPNYSVFKTINIPILTGEHNSVVSFISETLFDLDTLIEYAVDYTDSNSLSSTRICNENGSVLMQRDSGRIAWGQYGLDQTGYWHDNIFPDGNSMRLMVLVGVGQSAYMEIYSLPGQVNCMVCDNGVISGFADNQSSIKKNESSLAFPNPFTDYVKIKYSLPAKFQSAYVNILDVTGRFIKKKEINNGTDEVLIFNEEIKQGAYFYQIIVDGKVISGDKIIKIK